MFVRCERSRRGKERGGLARRRHGAPAWRAGLLLAALPIWGVARGDVVEPQAPSAPPPQPAYAVRILSPADRDYLSGPTVLEAEAFFPAGDPVARVEFYVDDVRVATVLRRPYRTDWDAGPEFLARRVRVVAISASGTRAAAEIHTRRLVPDQRAEVQLVDVYATVREKGHGYVTDLAVGDFVIEEEGRPQSITSFSRQERPVTWAVLLDVSASMQGARLDTARKAALLFVDELSPVDRAVAITFSDVIDSSPFTAGDHAPLRAMIESSRAGGGTALYDALVDAAERLRPLDGKKAVLLLSDGRDQGLDGYGPGSTHSFEEALERVQRAEVAVYAVGLGEDLAEQLDFQRRRNLRNLLEALSDNTGGRAHMVRREGGLREVFRQVAQEVRLQYSLGYSPSNSRRDGSWRDISVRVLRPGAQVTARRGYFAPAGP